MPVTGFSLLQAMGILISILSPDALLHAAQKPREHLGPENNFKSLQLVDIELNFSGMDEMGDRTIEAEKTFVHVAEAGPEFPEPRLSVI